MNDDDFSQYDGIFDDLTPEQFIQGVRADATEIGTFVGEENFKVFVRESLKSTRKSYRKHAKKRDMFQPVVMHCALVTPATKLIYSPQSGDTVLTFLTRLREDAKLISASWFFFAMKTVVGVHYVDRDSDAPEPDIGSPEAMTDAVQKGMMGEGILWHAERRENGEIQRRSGVLTIADKKIVEAIEGSETQSNMAFSNILP